MGWNDILKINWLRDDNVFIESFTIKEALELLRKRAVELEGQDGYDEINEAISMQLEVVKILEGRNFRMNPVNRATQYLVFQLEGQNLPILYLNLGSFIVLESIKKIGGKDHMVVDLAETLICEINSFNYVYGGMETGQSKMPKLRYLRLL